MKNKNQIQAAYKTTASGEPTQQRTAIFSAASDLDETIFRANALSSAIVSFMEHRLDPGPAFADEIAGLHMIASDIQAKLSASMKALFAEIERQKI